jgi:hypothetical protein
MILIELFDRTPVENIIATLALKPEKVFFVGSDARKARLAVPLYQQILEGRGMKVDMQVRSAAKNDLENITEVFYDIIMNESDGKQIVVDISGGDESTLVAVGMILGSCSMKNKRLYAFRINAVSRRGVLFEVKNGEDLYKQIKLDIT